MSKTRGNVYGSENVKFDSKRNEWEYLAKRVEIGIYGVYRKVGVGIVVQKKVDVRICFKSGNGHI